MAERISGFLPEKSKNPGSTETVLADSQWGATDFWNEETESETEMSRATTRLDGTELPLTVTTAGNTSTYGYDYRQRVTSTSVQSPRSG